MPNKVLYERVNLADIETSSDEDDYGDLFAQERRNGHGKSRPLRNLSKKKGQKFSFCCQGFVVITSVLALLATMAGVALYMDPEGSLLNMVSGNSTEDIRSDGNSSITLPSVWVINSTITNSTIANPSKDNSTITNLNKANSTITNSSGVNKTITRAPESATPKPGNNPTGESDKKPSKASGAESPGKSEEALATWSSSALTSSEQSSGRLRARFS